MAEWPWRYRWRSKFIMYDTPHVSDHLSLIWKESIQKCRSYKVDTASGTDMYAKFYPVPEASCNAVLTSFFLFKCHYLYCFVFCCFGHLDGQLRGTMRDFSYPWHCKLWKKGERPCELNISCTDQKTSVDLSYPCRPWARGVHNAPPPPPPPPPTSLQNYVFLNPQSIHNKK